VDLPLFFTLPLIGGYAFVTSLWSLRWRSARQDSQRLYYRAAVYGILIAAGVEGWLAADPTVTAKELMGRLARTVPDEYSGNAQLRSLQRRIKTWRAEKAKDLILGRLRSHSSEDVKALQGVEPKVHDSTGAPPAAWQGPRIFKGRSEERRALTVRQQRSVTFFVEATRPAKVIVVNQPVETSTTCLMGPFVTARASCPLTPIKRQVLSFLLGRPGKRAGAARGGVAWGVYSQRRDVEQGVCSKPFSWLPYWRSRCLYGPKLPAPRRFHS